MEQNKDKRNEQASSVKTPTPPQVMSPLERKDDAKEEKDEKQQQPSAQHKPSDKKLGESPLEIDDETTI